MPIELRCPGCNQQLRVPDTAAGKNARCPKCATVVKVPAAAPVAPPPPPPPPPPSGPSAGGMPDFNFGKPAPAPAPFNFGAPTQPAPPPTFPVGAPPPPSSPSPFAFGQPAPKPPAPSGPFAPGGAYGTPPPPSNPFASTDLGGAYGGGAPVGPINPYASPSALSSKPATSGKVKPTRVSAGDVLNYASTIWQRNLGLLVGVCFVQGILVVGVQWGIQAAQMALLFADQRELFMVASFVLPLVNLVWQTFLNIGLVQICLKLARQQPADFADLFGGAGRLPPVLGFNVLIFVAAFVVSLCAVLLSASAGRDAGPPLLFGLLGVVGVLSIVLVLFWWPIPSLLIDNRSSFGSSFGVAARITEGNKLTSFLLWLLSVGIVLAGMLACIIGLLFAVPLIWMIWAVAYLMMSGQIPTRPSMQSKYS